MSWLLYICLAACALRAFGCICVGWINIVNIDQFGNLERQEMGDTTQKLSVSPSSDTNLVREYASSRIAIAHRNAIIQTYEQTDASLHCVLRGQVVINRWPPQGRHVAVAPKITKAPKIVRLEACTTQQSATHNTDGWIATYSAKRYKLQRKALNAHEPSWEHMMCETLAATIYCKTSNWMLQCANYYRWIEAYSAKR